MRRLLPLVLAELILASGAACSSGGASFVIDLSSGGGSPDLSMDPPGDLGPGRPDQGPGPADLRRSDGGGVVPPPGFHSFPPSKFRMGRANDPRCWSSVETGHDVTLTHGFELMTTEVNQAQFADLMGYNPSAFPACGITCPVEQVTWHEAVAYCNELSSRRGLTPCYVCTGSGDSVRCNNSPTYDGKQIYGCPGYRLPSDAEWELAYRASTTTAYYNGPLLDCNSNDANLDAIGWYKDNSLGTTHPVAGKAPNTAALYDMSGNVWEWCHDLWDVTPDSAPVTDPIGTRPGNRTLRGGAWDSPPWFSTASYRFGAPAENKAKQYGFRCARTL